MNMKNVADQAGKGGGVGHMTLKEYMQKIEVDAVEDDELFCEKEYDVIRGWIAAAKGNVTKEDAAEIESRGYSVRELVESYSYWDQDEAD